MNIGDIFSPQDTLLLFAWVEAAVTGLAVYFYLADQTSIIATALLWSFKPG